MKWFSRCPYCNEMRNVDWEKRQNKYQCHKDNTKIYTPFTPSQDSSGYVDTHNWPEEIETIVIGLKGKNCTVPGCSKKYQTLDHRIPWSKNGKTSVENLFPMCTEHNLSKSDTEYETWLKSQKIKA